MDGQLIGIIIQSGSVGISVALIWLMNQNSKRHQIERQETTQTLTNHLATSSKVLKEVANSNIKIARCLQKITDKLDQLQIKQ